MRRPTLIFVVAVGLLVVLKFPETEARMTLAQMKNAMKGMAKTCAAKSGVAPDVLAQSKKGEFLPDKALQCYFLCLFGQMKIVNKEGVMSLEVMHKQVDMMMPLDIIDRAKEVTRNCFAAVDSDDACERSWQFTKCFYETDQSIYFLP